MQKDAKNKYITELHENADAQAWIQAHGKVTGSFALNDSIPRDATGVSWQPEIMEYMTHTYTTVQQTIVKNKISISTEHFQ